MLKESSQSAIKGQKGVCVLCEVRIDPGGGLRFLPIFACLSICVWVVAFSRKMLCCVCVCSVI